MSKYIIYFYLRRNILFIFIYVEVYYLFLFTSKYIIYFYLRRNVGITYSYNWLHVLLLLVGHYSSLSLGFSFLRLLLLVNTIIYRWKSKCERLEKEVDELRKASTEAALRHETQQQEMENLRRYAAQLRAQGEQLNQEVEKLIVCTLTCQILIEF